MYFTLPKFIYVTLICQTIFYIIICTYDLVKYSTYYRDENYQITKNFMKNMISYVNRSLTGHQHLQDFQ